MTESTRRERLRGDMDRDIRVQTRHILVEHGRDAISLRAIARQLGITAPALYRYYSSREDLLRKVCDDICADLGAELTAELSTIAEDGDSLTGVFVVCRGFRRWALAHPKEFSLVFATPADETGKPAAECSVMNKAGDQFGRIFLIVAGKVLAKHHLPTPPTGNIPVELHSDLEKFRNALVETLNQQGIELPEYALSPTTLYFMLQFWVRLYGHVALEVFGRFPFALSSAEALFESMLIELASDISQLTSAS